MKLRVGLVGLGGSWEVRYRPALRALSDRFEVRAVCDQVAHLAQRAASEFSSTPVDGFRAMAEREDIDAILMLASQWSGSLPILAACDMGKSVYCAASLDLDVAQAERIRKRVEQSGIAFMAEFPRRQAPATLRLKELIATRLGAPRLLFCHARIPAEDPTGVRVPGLSQHSAMHNLIELVDWCRYVVASEPTSVFGLMHKSSADGSDDYEMMSLDFSTGDSLGNGPVAQISCGRYMPADWQEAVSFRPPAALQVACEHGIAFIDLPSTLVWFDKAGRHLESLDSERPVGERLLAQFHRAVTSLVLNNAGFDDAFRGLAIVLQARASHAQGRRMPLSP